MKRAQKMLYVYKNNNQTEEEKISKTDRDTNIRLGR